ncbi:hypothetical protein [Mycobacterium spongiae]|uniref:Uncharacterized protein n=1 Tax=Mycobacterium spongiae TaxID=886343 RepID=A0A975PX49_9MYCO|nr:hypothetical protein [Mycobacterium spongiae]QUR67378.1 hypothetical protein F6B93_09970 [Mycobacterium spongiae]
MTSRVTVTVTLHDGQVITFDTSNTDQEAGTSYSVDAAGVLTIESKQPMPAGELVVTRQLYSPAAWHRVDEANSTTLCAVPAWVSGVIGSSI